jgi:hypothetical protein
LTPVALLLTRDFMWEETSPQSGDSPKLGEVAQGAGGGVGGAQRREREE